MYTQTSFLNRNFIVIQNFRYFIAFFYKLSVLKFSDSVMFMSNEVRFLRSLFPKSVYCRQHFDLTSPSVGNCESEVFPCPLCAKSFNSAPDLELHVNIEHRDVLSPASPSTYSCPVCGISLDNDSNVSLVVKRKYLNGVNFLGVIC